MKNIQIIGTGMAKASGVVTNEDLAGMVDTSDEWIVTRTGISERRFCTKDEDAGTLAVAAAKNAIDSAQIGVDEIGCVICGTVSGEYVTPSLACVVQRNLGLPEDIPVLDVNAACSGFIYGLEVARGLLNGNGGRYGLVIGCEHLSKLLDMADRSTCVLFGDGAGAAVVEAVEGGTYESVLGARGGYEIMVEGPGEGASRIRMDGTAVFKFAVEAIPKCVRQLQEKAGISLDEVNQVVCHQANARIIDHCIRKMRVDGDKFYKNMDRFGNTSAASVPMALDELVKGGTVRAGDVLMLVGFGGGLTWAGVLIEMGGKG